MIYHAHEAEQAVILSVAQQLCVAARTAPKTCGIDHLQTMILTGEEKDALASRMEDLAEPLGFAFFRRDAACVRKSGAIVLFGVNESVRGIGAGCGYCHKKDCAECAKEDAVCVYDPIDLGIAVGSAAASAADSRVDSRVLFSAGRAALEDKLMGEGVTMVLSIALSASGKSPFFDRK
ncbi:MAG: ferredoxin [Oscillospiraceae bacterium]|nr:ferredoxin [Oscillospiraceae bacterium]